MQTEIVKAEEFGLEKTQVNNVDLAFSEKVKERELLSEIFGQLIKKDINAEVAKEARELRLKAVKVKSSIASIHKSQKEFALAFGKYCDAWKRKETEPIQQIIDGAMEIEKFEEIERQKRLDELQRQRVEILSQYVDDANERDLSSMESDVWEAYLMAKKNEYEEKIEAERKAEAERIAKEKAEAEERERVRIENERLKKEAEERERLAKIEAEKRAKAEAEMIAKIEAERKKREEEERKQKEVYEAKLKAEREEKERVEREERLKREKLEAEIKAQKEAEAKRLAEIEAKKQEELSKGDSEKVLDLISDLKNLKTKYEFKSEKNKKMYSDVSVLIEKVINHINK
jgi:colicin import membrane protein